VENVTYVSRADAYKQFQEQFKDAPDLVKATKPDALPESFRVKLHNPKQFQEVSDRYKNRDGVDEVVDQQKLLGTLFKVLGSLQNLALVVAIVQGLAALLLVANTIQVAAYSKRREVAVMKLVGAANWFIQLPFVLEAVFAGLIGAIIAFLTLVAAKIFLFDGTLKPLASLLTPVDWSNVLLMLPILAGVAAAVSAVTGWITLRFYVRV
jgi:cell division transport system permease protein